MTWFGAGDRDASGHQENSGLPVYRTQLLAWLGQGMWLTRSTGRAERGIVSGESRPGGARCSDWQEDGRSDPGTWLTLLSGHMVNTFS